MLLYDTEQKNKQEHPRRGGAARHRCGGNRHRRVHGRYVDARRGRRAHRGLLVPGLLPRRERHARPGPAGIGGLSPVRQRRKGRGFCRVQPLRRRLQPQRHGSLGLAAHQHKDVLWGAGRHHGAGGTVPRAPRFGGRMPGRGRPAGDHRRLRRHGAHLREGSARSARWNVLDACKPRQ